MKKKNINELKIGILGGSGALASAVFLLDITRAWARNAKPRTDSGYPEILYLSSPFKAFTAKGIANETSVKKQLKDKIRFFAENKVNLLFIPCVSLMGVADGLPLEGMKLVSLIDETNRHLAQKKYSGKKVLVLSSDYTRKKRMFKAPGCELAYLSGAEQKVIDALILSAMAGEQKTDLRAYNSMINRRKPDFILLGCTELPLIFQNANSKHIDPLKIAINEYFGR